MNVMAAVAIMLSANEHKMCPCCSRMVRSNCAPSLVGVEKSNDFHQDFKLDTDRVLNDEIMNPINSLKDFGFPSTAQKKLVAYLRAKEHLARNGHETGENRSPVFHELSFFEPTLSSLTRTRPCSRNTYITPGQSQGSIYQNEATADIVKLAGAFETVQECPWYWGEMNKCEANEVLHEQPLGTFLLRNSSDKRFLFSLSVVTEFGPASIRIVYSGGKFSFDVSAYGRSRSNGPDSSLAADERDTCVIYMILHHTQYLKGNDEENPNKENLKLRSILSSSGRATDEKTDTKDDRKTTQSGVFLCSWMSPNGIQKFPLPLIRPHSKGVPTLHERTRLSISKELELWKNPQKAESLPLSTDFKRYLNLYPYPV